MDDISKKFLLHIFKQADGDVSASVSMYDIGSDMGIEKDQASSITQFLVGEGLLELVSLSGLVCLTEQGITELVASGMINTSDDKTVVFIKDTYILDKHVHQAVELLVAQIKCFVSHEGMDYELLEELLADIKTIDVQLLSPRPKTAIIKLCMGSIELVIEKTKAEKLLYQIRNILGK